MDKSINIYAPKVSKKSVHSCVCLDCKRRTRMLCFFTDWYGWESTCIKCGRNWHDGEWMPLEFARGIRQHMIETAKKRFRMTKIDQ